jgi:hexosaminidase
MNTNKLLLILSFAFFQIPVFAQLNLIPQPQKAEQQKGFFEIKKNISLISNYPSNHQNQALVKWFKESLNIEFSTIPRIAKNNIQLLRQPNRSAFKTLLEQEGMDPDFDPEKEGYVLQVTSGNVKIIATTHTGIFYGIQTLKQIISANSTDNKIPCLVIYDKPDFPVRAWQDDISRGPIPTMEMLKGQIRLMSAYKLNYFTLYTEHTFKLDKHPGIAPEDGITKAELKELTNYARKHHVTLIGNYQSFGHMEETLSHPDYKHLAENDHIISPALEASYDFLKDVYSEIVPVYDGQFFNINCDETFGLGEGESKAMVEELGIDGVYLYHINRLNDLLEPYGKSILMWGILRANTQRS